MAAPLYQPLRRGREAGLGRLAGHGKGQDRRRFIDLTLSGKQIAIAREAADVPCLFDTVLRHYLRYAGGGEAAFDRLILRVTHALEVPAFAAAADAALMSGRNLTDLVIAAVERELVSYDLDRQTMQKCNHSARTAVEVGCA